MQLGTINSNFILIDLHLSTLLALNVFATFYIFFAPRFYGVL